MAGSPYHIARIVAAAIASGIVLGLLIVGLVPSDDVMVVPAGSQPGDLVLVPCDYSTEAGAFPADCGTLVVAENPAEPNSRLLAVPVIRIRAKVDNPGEPIFRLEGGPGMTNMSFPLASRFVANHDVVLVGYRGVDGSVRLDCPEVEAALNRSRDFLGEESLAAYSAAYRSCADRLTSEGFDLSRYGLVQQVDDLETVRLALGYDRINLLSESAGTRTAMIYSWRYPRSIHRSVMVSVNPPGHFLFDARTTDEQLGRYSARCAEDPACRARTDDLAASIRRTAADMPRRWLFLRIKPGNVSITTFFAMMESTSSTGVTSGPAFFDAWLSTAEGDPSGFWVASVLADLVYPKIFVWGQYASAAIIDAQAARHYFATPDRDWGANLGRAATAYPWGGGGLVDAWPAASEGSDYDHPRFSGVETLLVSGELDAATPPQVASTELLPYLPNGHEVVLDGFAHTPSFWADQPEAGTRLVTTFFDSGRVDDSLYVAQDVRFTPPVTLGGVARTLLATMLALAVVTVLSLVVLALRVRANGRIGPGAGVVLRTAGPVVFGLGGWFLCSLVVLAALPAARIDNRYLVVVSVGLTVGIGVFLAWVHRGWPAPDKGAGLVLAIGGALVVAWIGFHADPGPAWAIGLTIVGAIAGANLPLVLLDIARDRARSGAERSTVAGE